MSSEQLTPEQEAACNAQYQMACSHPTSSFEKNYLSSEKLRELYAINNRQAAKIVELESAIERTEKHWREELEAYKTTEKCLVDAERLAEIRQSPRNGGVTDVEDLCDDLMAARARIAELERALLESQEHLRGLLSGDQPTEPMRLSVPPNAINASGDAFAKEFGREPETQGDAAWMNGYAAAMRPSPEPTAPPNDDYEQVYDLFSIGASVRTPSTLLANCKNALRRSECLDAIEREFFTSLVDVEDGEEGEQSEECAMSWGVNPAEYVEQFRSALELRASPEPNRAQRSATDVNRSEIQKGGASPETPTIQGFACKCGVRILYGRKHLNCPADETKGAK